MKTLLLTAFCTGVVVLLNVETLQAEWLGSNLVTNGDFSARSEGWIVPGYASWTLDSFQAGCRYNGTIRGSDIHQTVSIQPGKRYRISGQSYAYYQGGEARCRTRVEAFGLFSTDWWGPGTSKVLTTKTAEGIITDRTEIYFMCTYDNLMPGYYGEVLGVFDNVGLYQVVYSPQISISQKQNGARINSNTPGGSSANISLTLNNATGYADALTSWSMNWGDGVIEPNPTFNSHSHIYSIASSNSQTWTSTFSGTNQADTVFDIDTVTILRQPDIALMVNSLSVMDGETIVINIFDNPTLNLSLLNSKGYLEGASFQIDGKLNQSGSDLSSFFYSGNLFNQSDIGHIYTLTSGIYNTGLGVNSDYLSVDLSIVPEPTTVLLLGLGAVMLRKRC